MSEIKKIIENIKAGRTTATDEVKSAIARARQDDSNAILEVIEKRALKRAAEVDKEILQDNFKKLSGIPFVAKDNYLTLGSKTTAASKILKDFESPLQATAIERLEAEGAICIGKANLDSFAHGCSTENSAFGVTKNAVDPTRVSGGSSGGSAVAVAKGIVPFALGSDTGGSIRQPASFNGCVGFKPSYGLISRYGVIAMASSTDVVGPITRTVADAELITEVLAGPDGKDMTVLPDKFTPLKSDKKYRIGIIKEYMADGIDANVKNQTTKLTNKLEKAGHQVQEISMPTIKHALAIYYIVVPAEISSNLARYDGIRYGQRASGAQTLAEIYGRSRDEGFVDENKRRILVGTFVLSSGFYDAYYQKAQKARTLLINDFKKAFEDVDFLIGPVAPSTAFKISEYTNDPLKAYMEDILTVPPSLAGLPAISVPTKLAKDDLPIGVQIIAPYAHDADLLNLAREIERIENE